VFSLFSGSASFSDGNSVRQSEVLCSRFVMGRGGIFHYHHTRALVQLLSMCIVTILVGRILGFALFVIPMYPSQPFPFEQPSLYRDVRSSILDYTNPSTGVASHHLLACDANISLHFPKLR
jgi:hypothetical protein